MVDRIRTAEIDLATYLVSEGYSFQVEKEGKTIYFVFEGEGLEEKVKQFPNSKVNHILGIYYGLQKVVRTSLATQG